MAGMGPPPKPEGQQRRPGRGLTSQTTRLPAEGRKGATPDWPLGKPTVRERALWTRLWTTPQAVAWERLGWVDVVARYARQLVVAERRNPPVTVLSEVRQLEDRLGLTPLAMLRLRWEIAPDEVAAARGDRAGAEAAAAARDPRARLRAVATADEAAP